MAGKDRKDERDGKDWMAGTMGTNEGTSTKRGAAASTALGGGVCFSEGALSTLI